MALQAEVALEQLRGDGEARGGLTGTWPEVEQAAAAARAADARLAEARRLAYERAEGERRQLEASSGLYQVYCAATGVRFDDHAAGVEGRSPPAPPPLVETTPYAAQTKSDAAATADGAASRDHRHQSRHVTAAKPNTRDATEVTPEPPPQLEPAALSKPPAAAATGVVAWCSHRSRCVVLHDACVRCLSAWVAGAMLKHSRTHSAAAFVARMLSPAAEVLHGARGGQRAHVCAHACPPYPLIPSTCHPRMISHQTSVGPNRAESARHTSRFAPGVGQVWANSGRTRQTSANSGTN